MMEFSALRQRGKKGEETPAMHKDPVAIVQLLQHVSQMLEHASDKYGKPLWKPTVTLARLIRKLSSSRHLGSESHLNLAF